MSRLGDALSLAATPIFLAMAVLTAVAGGPGDVLCSAGPAAPLTGMPTMYGLMAAFHLSPWLRRAARR